MSLSRRTFLKAGVLATSGLVIGGAIWRHYDLAQSGSLRQISGQTPQAHVPFVAQAGGTPASTNTATLPPSSTATATDTHTPTATDTDAPTATDTDTPTATDTDVPTATDTHTATATGTNTPSATSTSGSSTPRVVHSMSPEATDWSFGNDWFGDHIDQGVVDRMTDEGLMQLTGATSRAEAWLALLPNYQSGQQVAIKVNFNNCLGDGPCGNAINALIEPVNALIQGLIERGVAATNIWVFDVTHAWHDGRMDPRFIAGCDFPGVHFVAYVGESNPYSSTEFIHFNTPPGGPSINDLPLCNVLVNADYLINMPIVKVHPFTGVTLGFKNHFGSFDRCDHAHTYTPGCPSNIHPCHYDPNYSPLIDIYSNPHIRDKTILTVGECLFGAWSDPVWIPLPWSTFGNGASNSLFFASDPVAIECVMTDILEAETALLPQTDDYLRLAGQVGLGVYERGNPWGAGYEQIDYLRIEV